jgi:hypothetical protein
MSSVGNSPPWQGAMQCAFNYIHGHSAVIAFSLDTAVRRDRAVEVQGPGPWSRSPQSARVGRPGRPTRVPHAREALRYSVVGPNSGRHQHAAEAAKPVAGGGWVPVGAYYRRDTRAGGEFAPTGDSALVGAWLLLCGSRGGFPFAGVEARDVTGPWRSRVGRRWPRRLCENRIANGARRNPAGTRTCLLNRP